jgi:hypothetical protein
MQTVEEITRELVLKDVKEMVQFVLNKVKNG